MLEVCVFVPNRLSARIRHTGMFRLRKAHAGIRFCPRRGNGGPRPRRMFPELVIESGAKSIGRAPQQSARSDAALMS